MSSCFSKFCGMRFPGRPAASFSPLSLSPALWLKADGVLWQDSARTTLATADGDPVGAWDDASGNARHVLQATAAKRFSLQTAEQNGLAIARSDGTDDFLQVTGVNIGSQPVTYFLVAKMSGVDGTVTLDGGATGFDRCSLFYGAGVSGRLEAYAGGATILGAAHTTGAYHVYEAVFNGASSSILVDGSSIATGTVEGGVLGAGITLGSLFDGASGFSATDFAELIVCTGGLVSAANVTATRAYLKAKWGTP